MGPNGLGEQKRANSQPECRDLPKTSVLQEQPLSAHGLRSIAQAAYSANDAVQGQVRCYNPTCYHGRARSVQ